MVLVIQCSSMQCNTVISAKKCKAYTVHIRVAVTWQMEQCSPPYPGCKRLAAGQCNKHKFVVCRNRILHALSTLNPNKHKRIY